MTEKRIRCEVGGEDIEQSEDVKAPPIRLELERLDAKDGFSREIVDSPDNMKLAMEKARGEFAQYFRTERDFQDFMMLPIALGERHLFIERVQRIQANLLHK